MSVLLTVLAAGCAAGGPAAPPTPAAASSAPAPSESAAVPEPVQTTDPVTADPVTGVPGPLDELSPDDDLAMNPPPPAHVRAGAVAAGAVELIWDEPPTVSVPHTYSDRVVEYRIYRSGGGDVETALIGSSTTLGFADGTARSGQRYEYTVTSVREQHVEGSMSYPSVTVTVS